MVRNREGEAPAAGCLIEALLAMDGPGVGTLRLRRSEHHG